MPPNNRGTIFGKMGRLYQQGGGRAVVRGVKHHLVHQTPFQHLHTAWYTLAESINVSGPNNIYTDQYYAKRTSGDMFMDAQHIGSVLNDYYQPQSVIDLGCAVGSYLLPFHNQGVDVLGVEVVEAAHEHAVIPNRLMTRHDLRQPYYPPRRYDLVLSVEVAEHLKKRYAGTFVDSLTRCGDTVVMTAAQPGQGGIYHVNEQPRDYWKWKFDRHGYHYVKEDVETLRDRLNPTHSYCVPDNLFVFKRQP